jgi:hypothetical protein
MMTMSDVDDIQWVATDWGQHLGVKVIIFGDADETVFVAVAIEQGFKNPFMRYTGSHGTGYDAYKAAEALINKEVA